jgi:enediyne biosynthesis protein E5
MTTTGKPVASIPAVQEAGKAGQAGEVNRWKDPRYLALRNFAMSITVFNIFGYTLLGWEQPFLWPVFAVLTAYATEAVFEVLSAWVEHRRPGFLGEGPKAGMAFFLPAHITALAANMLLYANNQWWPVMFCVVVAVAQKHVLRAPIKGRMRHFMNPSNLGIAVSLLVLGNWVSISPPYMFTEWANTYFRMMIPMVILTAGTVLNALLTKKIPLIVGWMGAFAIQAFVRHFIWGVQLNTALGVMTGVAFVLFSNYMITDPATSPSKPMAMFMFGSATAFVYGILMAFNIVYTLFFALAIVCAVRGLGWWVADFRRKRREAAAPASALGQADTRLREQAVAT